MDIKFRSHILNSGTTFRSCIPARYKIQDGLEAPVTWQFCFPSLFFARYLCWVELIWIELHNCLALGMPLPALPIDFLLLLQVKDGGQKTISMKNNKWMTRWNFLNRNIALSFIKWTSWKLLNLFLQTPGLVLVPWVPGLQLSLFGH